MNKTIEITKNYAMQTAVAMEDKETYNTSKGIEKAFRRTALLNTLMSLFVAILSTMTIGFGFYYNTKATLEQHEKDIREIKIDQATAEIKINDIQIFRGVSSAQMKNLVKKVDKIDEKLDRILLKMK